MIVVFALIGANIKKAREERNLSQAELGAKLGVTATAINYYEKGKRKINIGDLYRLAGVLGKPLEYFLAGRSAFAAADLKHYLQDDMVRDLVYLPVVGTIRAGEPVLSEQNIESYLPFPREMIQAATFALWVTGDSMTGEGIEEGDLVFIRQQEHVDFNGQIVCALVNGEENTLKIFWKDENGVIYLKAANPNYPDIMVEHEDDLKIQGVYAGVFKLPRVPDIYNPGGGNGGTLMER
ncbi:MAG: LexA family transcriptional regulator [Peptococcaceae bacterium]|nr:MAG: LexA family transcriptional regulator [Peptococcaceae bacterium]